jgi:hypothetical protein
VEALPPKERKAVTALSSSTTLSVYLARLHDMEETFDFRLKMLDKKTERLLLHHHTKALKENVNDSKRPYELRFHSYILLLFLKHTAVLLHAPPKVIPSLITAMEKHIGKEEVNRLKEYNAIIIQKVMAKESELKNSFDVELIRLWNDFQINIF